MNTLKIIAVNLRRQIELDGDPKKTIQQIEFFGQLKSTDSTNAESAQSIFVVTIFFRKGNKHNKIFSRKHDSLIKDGKL